jgi:hypothetical protein
MGLYASARSDVAAKVENGVIKRMEPRGLLLLSLVPSTTSPVRNTKYVLSNVEGDAKVELHKYDGMGGAFASLV